MGAISEEKWMKKGQGVAVWGEVNLLAVHNILNTFLTFTMGPYLLHHALGCLKYMAYGKVLNSEEDAKCYY